MPLVLLVTHKASAQGREKVKFETVVLRDKLWEGTTASPESLGLI